MRAATRERWWTRSWSSSPADRVARAIGSGIQVKYPGGYIAASKEIPRQLPVGSGRNENDAVRPLQTGLLASAQVPAHDCGLRMVQGMRMIITRVPDEQQDRTTSSVLSR